MLCGRTSSIITATLSLLLAAGMHMASDRRAPVHVAVAQPPQAAAIAG